MEERSSMSGSDKETEAVADTSTLAQHERHSGSECLGDSVMGKE